MVVCGKCHGCGMYRVNLCPGQAEYDIKKCMAANAVSYTKLLKVKRYERLF